jgi:hypothetical protein
VYVPAPPASSMTMTPGQWAQVESAWSTYIAKSCLILETTADTPASNKGQAGACPDRARTIPCTVRVAPGANRSYATADDVPVACPIGRSAAGTYGHSGTTRPIGSPANRQADPLRKPTL